MRRFLLALCLLLGACASPSVARPGFGLIGLRHHAGVVTITPTLGPLVISPSTDTVGSTQAGVILGATPGSVITATGLPSFFTFNSGLRTISYDGTGTAGLGSFTFTETLAGANGSPKNSTINYTLNSAPSSAFTYDTAMGTAVDANGFTSLPLRAGAHAFYVNSSIGSDANTCAQAQTASTPKATYASAKVCPTDGAGDHILFSQDTSYVAGLEPFVFSGFSPQYPFTVESYDPADPTNQAKWGRATGTHRPVLNTGGTAQQNYIWGNPYSYVAVRGLDFNPGNLDGMEFNITSGAGTTNYILIENDIFRYTSLNFNHNPTGAVPDPPGYKFIVRNCSLYGEWTAYSGAGEHGIYVGNVQGVTIEDDVFWHNGWKIGLLDTDSSSIGGRNPFNHPIYAQSNTTPMVARRNVFINTSSDGGNLKGGGYYQSNLSIRNANAWAGGSGNALSIWKPFGSYIEQSFNVAIGSNNINGLGAVGWGAAANDGKANGNAIVRYNLLARNDQSSGNLFLSLNSADPDYGFLNPDNTVFDHNVGYLWNSMGGNSADFINGTLATATNNKWDDAPSGSNTTVSGGSFTNAYTESTLLTALGYASETAAINDWIANPEQHKWRPGPTLALAGYNITMPGQVDLVTDMRITAGVANAGMFVGTLDGYDLSAVSGLPACVTLDSGGRAWRATTACTASSGTLVLRESNGASSHDSSIPWTIYSAPVLSGLSVTPGTTTATVNVSTTVASGKIYALADPSTTVLYWPIVRAGNDNVGSRSHAAWAAAANQAVSATGAQPAMTLTGLTASTAYRLQETQVDANNNPSSVGTYDFTTSALVTTTWNPSDKGTDITLTNTNLTAEQNTGFEFVRATVSKTSGKEYFEVLINNSTGGAPTHQGVAFVEGSYGVGSALPGTGGLFFSDLGIVAASGSTAGTAPSGSIVDGTVLGVAVDASTGHVWFAINNSWGGNPAAGTGYSTYTLTAPFPACGELQGKCTARFTAASQTYAPPTGFASWEFMPLGLAVRRRRRRKAANDNAVDRALAA